MSKKERLVAAIESGTVIDHIPAEKTFQVVNLLQLQKLSTPVTIGFNFSSKMVGTKGIIKVSDKFFTDDEISRLSVVAPNVVLNIINDYEVVEKKKVVTPDELRSIVRCNTQSVSLIMSLWIQSSMLSTRSMVFLNVITATKSRKWRRLNWYRIQVAG